MISGFLATGTWILGSPNAGGVGAPGGPPIRGGGGGPPKGGGGGGGPPNIGGGGEGAGDTPGIGGGAVVAIAGLAGAAYALQNAMYTGKFLRDASGEKKAPFF